MFVHHSNLCLCLFMVRQHYISIRLSFVLRESGKEERVGKYIVVFVRFLHIKVVNYYFFGHQSSSLIWEIEMNFVLNISSSITSIRSFFNFEI